MSALLLILNILNSALAVLPAGTDIYNKLKAQQAQAQQWADTNYTPTDADWQALNDSIAAKEAQIDSLTR